MRLAEPSQDTLVLTHAALRGLTRIYKSEYRYQKAGVMLLNLRPTDQGQLSLFPTLTATTAQRERLLEVMDRINRDLGRDTLWTAAQGLTQQEREDGWRMQRGNLSPAYTTRWAEIPRVVAG